MFRSFMSMLWELKRIRFSKPGIVSSAQTRFDPSTSTHFGSVWNQRGSGKWQDVHERLDKLCLSHPSPEVFIREDQTLEDECEQVIQTGMIRNFGEGTGSKIAIWELITGDELLKRPQISTLKNILIIWKETCNKIIWQSLILTQL